MIAFATAVFEQKKELPQPPTPLRHVWEWFLEIFNPGGYGMGPFPIEYQEIEAFSRVSRNVIEPVEAAMIRRLSNVFVSVKARESKTPLEKKTDMSDSKGLKELFSKAGAVKKQKKAVSRSK